MRNIPLVCLHVLFMLAGFMTLEIQIDGVDFLVVACEPQSGLVTAQTMIHAAGEPLRYKILRCQLILISTNLQHQRVSST